MIIRFEQQILIGFRVYGPGEVAELPDDAARSLIARRIAVEVAPAPIREAADPARAAARRAVKREGGRDAS